MLGLGLQHHGSAQSGVNDSEEDSDYDEDYEDADKYDS